MTTALYRRYRPETFGEMIGQSQVTDPLMTALRADRVGHAYLFSGPRGCGKTTSARILARCLNCAEGPTDVPCGTCASCVELSRDGGGSLDVVEIDAASHNGVDDARDLRERATFAPSRDRFKIFILDEAHMVTPQGFNALLKLVEEPPEHVKFIFATTEPEKVLGTIRSRTHHYPFRLVPPAAMLDYVEKLCGEEGVIVEQGVLPLVVRAGGGSPRDTLSLLDQLIAGSEEGRVTYARAVALLGYTHAELLDEIVDALAAGDAAAVFPAIDRVVQTRQDPRRFVDDLLERLRDLIVIAAVGDGASAVLRGLPEDEMLRMRGQAAAFGSARLSRTADTVSAALDDMSGATSPRLHLELMAARVLAHAGGGAEFAGVPGGVAASSPADPAARGGASVPPAGRVVSSSAPESRVAGSESAATDGMPVSSSASATSEAGATAEVVTPDDAGASAPGVSGAAGGEESSGTVLAASDSSASDGAAPAERASDDTVVSAASSSAAIPADAPAASSSSGPVDIAQILSVWPAVLTRLESMSRSAWLMATAVRPLAFDAETDVLTLGFASPHDVTTFKGATPGSGTPAHLRAAIEQEIGIRVKYLPAPLPAEPVAPPQEPDDVPAGGWYDDGPGSSGPALHGGSGGSQSSGSAVNAPRETSGHDASSAQGKNSAATHDAQGGRPGATGSSAATAVSEWAVATIPSSDPPPAAVAQLAVDEEPAEVESAASTPLPPTDGIVDRDEPPLPGDDEAPDIDEEPPYEFPSVPAESSPTAPRSAPAAPRSAPARTAARPDHSAPTVTSRSAAPEGVQRYGEAVIRQVLGARFVREEPYEPPTRFS